MSNVSPTILRARLARTKNTSQRIQLQAVLSNLLMDRDLSAAEKVVFEMLEESLTHEDHNGIALARLRLSQVFYSRGHLIRAADILKSLFQYFASTNDRGHEAECLYALAFVYRDLGDLPLAISYSLRASEIQQDLQMAKERVLTLGLIADLYQLLSDFTSALQFAMEGLTQAQKLGSKYLEAILRSTLADIHAGVGNYDEAIADELSALDIERQFGDSSWVGASLTGLTFTYLRLNEWDKALECATEALAIANRIGNGNWELICFANIAAIYSETGEFVLAEEYVSKSLALAKDRGDVSIYRFALTTRGRLRWRQGNLSESKHSYREALAQFKGFEGIQVHISALEDLISICKLQNDFKEALLYETSLADLRAYERKQKSERDVELHLYQAEIKQLRIDRERQQATANRRLKALEEQSQHIGEISMRLCQQRNNLLQLSKDLSVIQRASPRMELQRVQALLKDALRIGSRTANVEAVLSEIAPSFYVNLRKHCPDLSKTEQKICAFLKLDLQSQEIANLLNLSERTVETHRLHIRKKINLGRERSLVDYLREIA